MLTQTISTIPPQKPERETYIFGSLRQAAPMMQNMAIRYAHEYSELYQVAAEVALSYYGHARKKANPRAYLHRAIRNTILKYIGVTKVGRAQRLSDHYQILSLDAPMREKQNQPLSDLIEDVQFTQIRETPNYSRLYTIISSLPAPYAQVLCMRFGLCGYGVHRQCEIARLLGLPVKTVGWYFSKAKAMLQQHTELLDLIGYKE